MFTTHVSTPRLVAAVLTLSGLALPIVASAQDVPSYAQPATASADETITGRITSINGTFNITVNDDRGYVDNVELYQGTIINPTGLTLQDGMTVTLLGYADGAQFVANEIDTPYTLSEAAPPPTYYGAGWWYPGFAYGYGPAFSLGLIFGSGGSWHVDHEPFHGHPWSGSNGQAYGPRPDVRFTQPVRRTPVPIVRDPVPVDRATAPIPRANPPAYRAPIQGYRAPAPPAPQAPAQAYHAPPAVAPQVPIQRAPITVRPQVPIEAYHPAMPAMPAAPARIERAPQPIVREVPVQSYRAPEPAVRQAPAAERAPANRGGETRH
jgi:hypothetical protein